VPVRTADGQLLPATLSLSLPPSLQRDYPALSARFEAGLALGVLPELRAEASADSLAGQTLQFQWTDPRALWALQSLAMRGLLRFSTLAEERDRERERRRARLEPERESPEPAKPAGAAPRRLDQDGGPPPISTGTWLWHSARGFLRWLWQQLRS
jgi:hypothetical protein